MKESQQNKICNILTLAFLIINFNGKIYTNAQVARLGFTGAIEERIVAPCVNSLVNCNIRHERGECEAEDTAKEMLTRCPKSCKSCLPTKIDDCKENLAGDVSCELGLLLGYCLSGPTFHLRRCAKSCKAFIDVCSGALKPFEESPCLGVISLKDPQFDCGNQGMPSERTKSSRRIKFPSKINTKNDRKNIHTSKEVPRTRSNSESIKNHKSVNDESNIETTSTKLSHKKVSEEKMGRQQNIVELFPDLLDVLGVNTRVLPGIADTGYNLITEEDLITTSVILGSSAAILGVGFFSQFSQSQNGLAGQTQGQAQAQGQAQGQGQISSVSGQQGGGSLGNPSGFGINQNIGAIPIGTAGAGGNSASVAAPIVAAAAGAATIGGVAAVISASIVVSAARDLWDRRSRSSFETGRENDFFAPPPHMSRSVVPHCHATGYRELRKQLNELPTIDNGLPVRQEGLSIFKKMQFCKYGGNVLPAGIDDIIFDDTRVGITPPDNFIGISTPLSLRLTADADIPGVRKRRAAISDERILRIQLHTNIGSFHRKINKKANKKASKQNKIKNRTNLRNSGKYRQKRGISSLIKNFWTVFTGGTKSPSNAVSRRTNNPQNVNVISERKQTGGYPIKYHQYANDNIVHTNENQYLNSGIKQPNIPKYSQYTYPKHSYNNLQQTNFNNPSNLPYNTHPFVQKFPNLPNQPIKFQDLYKEVIGINFTISTPKPATPFFYDVPLNFFSTPEKSSIITEPPIIVEGNTEEIQVDDQLENITEPPIIVEGNTEEIKVDEQSLEDEVIEERYFCGGSLVTNTHIVTAAHCIDIPMPNSISLGEKGKERKFIIKEIFIYPDYLAKYKDHDIAILQLQEPVDEEDILQPYCVPNIQENLENETCVVSGWGTRPNKGPPEIVQNTTVIIRNNEECNQNYSSLGIHFEDEYPNGISEFMLCANGDKGEDVCQGDSGGPLVLDKEGKLVNIGIVSAGYGCGNQDTPGIYTRVDSYQDWIDFVIFGKCSDLIFNNKTTSILNTLPTFNNTIAQASVSTDSGGISNKNSVQHIIDQVNRLNNENSEDIPQVDITNK